MEFDRIGKEISGKYRVLSPLGSGGAASVYRCVHIERGVAVAVKLLDPAFAGPELRGRFEREARALSTLDHPNVVRVLDTGIWEDTPYIVMELLEGETLAERLRRGPLDARAALDVLGELLSALSYIHGAGLVHRDVKPANVFLEQQPGGASRVRLLDFGLAKFLTPTEGDRALTRPGQLAGTPAYMAPEQVAGDAADPRVDVYAAAIVAFEMLTGRVPFVGDVSEVMRRHVVDDVPFREALPPGAVAPAVVAVLERAAHKSRAARLPDAGVFLAELAAATAGARDAAPAVARRSSASDPTVPELPDAVPPAPAAPGTAVVADLPAASVPPRSGAAVRAVTWLAILVSTSAAVLALGVVYVLATPARERERSAVQRLLGVPPRPDPVAWMRPVPGAATGTSAPAAPPPGAVRSAAPEVASGMAVAQAPVAAAASAEPAAPPAAAERPPPSDPWVGAPREIARLLPKATRARGLDRPDIVAVHQYNAKHPDDPRGHIVLARSHVGRKWVKDAVTEYAIALDLDQAARGEPRMLRDLLACVAIGSPPAEELVQKTWGRDALPQVKRALQGRVPAAGRARLEHLRDELSR